MQIKPVTRFEFTPLPGYEYVVLCLDPDTVDQIDGWEILFVTHAHSGIHGEDRMYDVS